MKVFINEIFIFLATFILLALFLHMDNWLSNPMIHLNTLKTSPYGVFHPLMGTIVAYIVIGFFRLFLHAFFDIFSKKN